MEIDSLTTNELTRFLELTDKRGAQILSFLGKYSKHLEAILDTEAGKEILMYDIERLKILADKVLGESADDKELAEYRYLKKRLAFEADILKKYNKHLEQVRKVVNVR
jgi:hypothetical protein